MDFDCMFYKVKYKFMQLFIPDWQLEVVVMVDK